MLDGANSAATGTQANAPLPPDSQTAPESKPNEATAQGTAHPAAVSTPAQPTETKNEAPAEKKPAGASPKRGWLAGVGHFLWSDLDGNP